MYYKISQELCREYGKSIKFNLREKIRYYMMNKMPLLEDFDFIEHKTK